MKKLEKFEINSEKLIKKEDLQKLRGGDRIGLCAVYLNGTFNSEPPGQFAGVHPWTCEDEVWQCDAACAEGYSLVYPGYTVWCFCDYTGYGEY